MRIVKLQSSVFLAGVLVVLWAHAAFGQGGFIFREGVSPNVLANIRRSSDLETLILYPPPALGDDFIASLPEWPSLEHLNLSESKVTDDSLEWICRRKKLLSLNLSHAEITGKDLSCLNALEHLDFLDLSHNPLTPGCLSKLSIPSLKWLRLEGVPINDSDIEGVLGCVKLYHLDAMHCKISDRGVMRLADHPKLRTADICWADVSPEAVRAASKKQPKLTFIFPEEGRR